VTWKKTEQVTTHMMNTFKITKDLRLRDSIASPDGNISVSTGVRHWVENPGARSEDCARLLRGRLTVEGT
jgi:hypothetical protein